MSNRTILSCFSAIVCLIMVSAGCTPPPNDAMAAARDAIEQAKGNEIDKYAPKEFEVAAAELAKAEQHMAAEEYAEASEAAQKTIELTQAAGQEATVQKQLLKVDVDKKLPEFMERWGEISSSIEGGRGRAARALAAEASAFADSLTAQLNELKAGEKWYELNMSLDAANSKADEFAERAGG